MNRAGRPLFMKTYGKQNRKLEAWISPDNRKQVFASTSSSDLSVAEPSSPKPPARRGRKRSTADGSRAMRPAKTKTLSWTADGSRATRPAKTKALSCLRETDSDEENVFIVPPPLPHTQTQQQSSNTARKPVLRCAGRKAQRVVSTSESDGETATSRQQNPKRPKHTTARAKTRTHPSPVLAPGRFVTHRKGAETAKHKAPKRKLSVLLAQLSLNSSDDFVQGGGRGGGVAQRAFPRHATQGRRRALASADSSLADLGNSGVTNSKGFPRDISLNESSDRSSGPCHRKPLFSSTPSSRSLPPPHLLHPSISPSTSGIISLSTTQEELDVPEDPLRPSLSASLAEPRPGLRQLSPLGQASRQPEVGNCEEPTRRGSTSLRSSSSRNGGSVIQDGVGDQLSLDLFSVVSCEQTGPDGAGEETESGSHFVSATVGQDWLVEVVKERCLTRCCVVRLERVDKPHGDTAYSSCIDHTRSHNSGGSVDHTRSVTGGQSIDHSEICDPSGDHTGSVNDSQSGDHILNTDQSDVQILPVNDGQSADRAGNSGRSLDCTVSISQTNEEPVGLEVRAKQRCLTTHCQVQLQRLTVTRPHGETSLTVSRPHGETSLTVSRPHGETSLTVSRPHGETSLTVSRPHGETSLTVSRPHGETSLTVSRPHGETSLTVSRPHGETSLTVSRPHGETSLTVSRPHGETSLTVSQPHGETSLTVSQPHRETSLTVSRPHRETSLTVSRPHRETSLTVTRPHRETSLTVTQPHRETAYSSSLDHTRSDSDQCLKSDQSGDHNTRSDSGAADDHARSENVHKEKDSLVPKDNVPKRRKAGGILRESKRRSVSRERPATSRKAGVSGVSGNRWGRRDGAPNSRAAPPPGRAGDCSLTDLLSAQQTHKISSLSDSIVLGTPVRSNRLHLSSLLVNLTPDTHSWSRLKAALSLHRKTKAFLTPKTLPLYLLSSPGGRS
ncbi:uncharacterized protein LOC123481014 [Coregonus clupeaformis]|uniref:uncharacterized protein LOC123481014 n=1 Tax=Coregonus clupeaformis TaxID=59861 RepID=UPI001E1C43F3|nr:uncharacterized protein LOC123481014 [Coregonus clupeaformis]